MDDGPNHRSWMQLLEGGQVQSPTGVIGAPAKDVVDPLVAFVEGHDSKIRFYEKSTLSKHALFLGSIGSGKTNGMNWLVKSLRDRAGPQDVFVVFDSKGDFLENFHRDGDVVITNTPSKDWDCVNWNLFADLQETGSARVDEGFELASAIFAEQLEQAGQNFFFAAAARDVFAVVLEIMARESTANSSNRELRALLESERQVLFDLIKGQPDLAGAQIHLANERTGHSVLAFLQQTVKAAFSGTFREPGDFSIRDFVRAKGARGVFVEYDLAHGSQLLPIYRILLDLAITEAVGRARTEGNVYFVMDEFSLLPKLSHIADGINFGRSLGLRFVVGSQNVSQVYAAYGPEVGASILSGFGTVFAFRLTDTASRTFVSERFGRNRKRLTIEHAVRGQGVQEIVLDGNVIEDWHLSSLEVGDTIASLPDTPPFLFSFHQWTPPRGVH